MCELSCNRDTEDELSKVADERDDAKKEREEVKWQARQAEKRTAAAEEELDCVQQVRSFSPGPLCSVMYDALAKDHSRLLFYIYAGPRSSVCVFPDGRAAMG